MVGTTSGSKYQWPQEADQPSEVRQVIALVRESYPNFRWTRLRVTHVADDDRLWFFWLPDQPGEVQIEPTFSPGLFLVETDKHDERFEGATVEEVAQRVIAWLALPGGAEEPFWHPR